MSVDIHFTPAEYTDAGWANGIPDLHLSSWAKRREWQDCAARDSRLTAGAKGLVGLLASRSDDAGKPVWGSQSRIAVVLQVSVRSVVRYVGELAHHGYVRVFGSLPFRGPDGRWIRRKSNIYYLTVPKKVSRQEPPWRRRRRERAAMATESEQSSTSRLEDSSVTSTPERVAQPSLHPPISLPESQGQAPAPVERRSEEEVAQWLESCRTILRSARWQKSL
jgi:hypothetical protein